MNALLGAVLLGAIIVLSFYLMTTGKPKVTKWLTAIVLAGLLSNFILPLLVRGWAILLLGGLILLFVVLVFRTIGALL
jgi:hypothetical protein